jgi:ABC-type nitrate/sulfonate/bicarbonate transport system permease component
MSARAGFGPAVTSLLTATKPRRAVTQLVSVIAVLAVWEVAGISTSRALLAPPSEIFAAGYRLVVVEGVILDAMLTTARAFFIGYGVAVVLGLVIGVIMGRSRLAEYLLDPYVTFFYAVPSIALIPVLVIWFGIGDTLRVVLVVLASVFPVILNTAAGVKSVDRDLIEVGRSFCMSERKIAWGIMLPAALPFIFAGIRIGLSHALVGIIGAEIIAVITGLGGLIILYANQFKMPEMIVPILFIMALAVTITSLMNRAQRYFTRWETESVVK